jgi:hypothetical protein
VISSTDKSCDWVHAALQAAKPNKGSWVSFYDTNSHFETANQ